jgi:hypothetical protein
MQNVASNPLAFAMPFKKPIYSLGLPNRLKVSKKFEQNLVRNPAVGTV